MKIEEVKMSLLNDEEKVTNLNELNDLKVKYLGKKGLITELNSEIKNVPNEEKKEFGRKVNEIKELFNDFYEEKKNAFEEEILNKKLSSEAIDITLPATKVCCGAPNIMEKLIEEIEEVLKNSNISESEKEFMTVKVQKQMEEVDRKIIFKTIRRQHLRTDTVKVQNSKEELEYYIHDKLWIYTNKKVILKGGEDTSTYDATFTEDEIENLEKNIRSAKKLVEEIKTWK